jgi:hypothetical protein
MADIRCLKHAYFLGVQREAGEVLIYGHAYYSGLVDGYDAYRVSRRRRRTRREKDALQTPAVRIDLAGAALDAMLNGREDGAEARCIVSDVEYQGTVINGDFMMFPLKGRGVRVSSLPRTSNWRPTEVVSVLTAPCILEAYCGCRTVVAQRS